VSAAGGSAPDDVHGPLSGAHSPQVRRWKKLGDQVVEMRLKEPRIKPLSESEWTEDQRAALQQTYETGQYYNNWGTLARHWEAFAKLRPWGGYLSGSTTLPHRDREILLLRTAWLCRSKYVWDQHLVIGREKGVTDEEVARVQEGADAPGWSLFDAALVRAADELRNDTFISDNTWRALRAKYSDNQMMDVMYSVGTYTMVAMCMNSLGVQMDETFKGV
jgi:alkylhydroperoxidase family enzyme